MNSMFSRCSSVTYLPDISKWNISNVHNISGMFSQCKNLISLPDISKWSFSNLKYISSLFHGLLYFMDVHH